MPNIKVVFIQSVSESRDNLKGTSYPYSYVYDLVDTVANDYIAKGVAIPFVGWETNAKRPIRITFPK
ncbi:hypothetical protein [Priestia megaterium]|uniref:hypothetical protein n=1 Tax=Priestia megaterium TaxID=1404 RepID=UPI003D2CA061